MAANKDDVYEQLKALFPTSYQEDQLAALISRAKELLYGTLQSDSQPRYPGDYDEQAYERLTDKYAKLPRSGEGIDSFNELVHDLFGGVPRWRSPDIAYNICAAPNSAATAIYALALDENIHNVNSGLSGNTLVAEQAVTRILADMAGLKSKAYGLFTFGGTSTNLYGIKMGIKKCSPESTFTGLDGTVKILLTEDCHFSHPSNADWLGIGLDNALTIEADEDRTSSLADAEKKARKILDEGSKLATIIINGGTTYAHTIDDIKGFAELRDRLVDEYGLPYRPHLHVDSVIGWAWLSFKNYDFEANPLVILPEALDYLREQYSRISQIVHADSWGVDFHKGIGATPASSSMIMVNHFEDIALLSKKVSSRTEIHHLANAFSAFSPVDYTLETTRASGASLAALASLHMHGVDGIRRNLANLVEQTIFMRNLLAATPDIYALNADAKGFVTMVRFMQPGIQRRGLNESSVDELKEDNAYLNAFFAWDMESRISKGIGPEYSVSSSYIKSASGVGIAAIKLYPTSPHFDQASARRMVETLIDQKKTFDKTVWSQRV